jgi:N-acetylglucosamine kinase-like BadF-type ATPase
MRYVLGLDGGGTKCDAVLLTETGEVVGWGRGGPTHGWYEPPGTAEQSVRDAVRGALSEVQPDIACAAGLGHISPDRFGADVRIERGIGVGEVDMGFAAGLVTCGILILSGTGSFVHGRTRDGEHRHFGGLGPLLGDEGAGHDIGVMAMKAALTASYTPARATVLAERIPQALRCESRWEIVSLVYGEGLTRRQIASLAPIVETAANQGDAVSQSIMRRAAERLGEYLIDVIHELHMEDEDYAMVASGSIARNCKLWWERMCEVAHSVAPGLRPVNPKVRPVIGTCLLALKELGVEWNQDLLDTIIETQERFKPVTSGPA